jgi:hypothetical protein
MARFGKEHAETWLKDTTWKKSLKKEKPAPFDLFTQRKLPISNMLNDTTSRYQHGVLGNTNFTTHLVRGLVATYNSNNPPDTRR